MVKKQGFSATATNMWVLYVRRDWVIPIEIEPIGYVRVNYSEDEVRNSWIKGGVEGVIEIKEEYEKGLEGIDGFTHLILIVWMHKAVPWHRKVLKVRPKILTRFGIPESELPEVGVFSTDSPDRPNPIGVDIVEFLGRDGRLLKVRGLDLFDGTPVLDIKPFTPDHVPESSIKVPVWYMRLKKLAERVLGSNVRI